MADDRLTTLYNLSEAMTAAGKDVKEKHENEYKIFIEYLKTSENPKERILAAQLIARFFKYFPEHEHDAFDSIVDLCESADVDVRKHATMAMIAICQDCKQVVSKAADILIQLYQTNQASEVNLINQSLMTLLNLDIEKFLKSFFANFEDGSEQVRKRAIKFLSAKIHTVSENSLTKEIEEQLMNYAKKAMEDVTKDEFISFIGILSKLKIAKTNSGQATIVSAIKSQAEMDKDFDVNDQSLLEKFLLCTRYTIPFLSQYNRASEYVNYICLKILPHLGALSGSGTDLKVLQSLAEMSPHIILDDVPQLIDLEGCVKATYSKLLEYLPKPMEDSGADNTKPVGVGGVQAGEDQSVKGEESSDKTNGARRQEGGESGEKVAANDDETGATEPANGSQAATKAAPGGLVGQTESRPQEADFQFTHIEYLIYALIQLCRLKPELFSESMQVESRKQLFNLSNGCKKYTDALERQLVPVKKQDLMLEENKLRSVALRTTKNISAMIVGLFKPTCEFKTSITLSCVAPKLAHDGQPAQRPAGPKQADEQQAGQARGPRPSPLTRFQPGQGQGQESARSLKQQRPSQAFEGHGTRSKRYRKV